MLGTFERARSACAGARKYWAYFRCGGSGSSTCSRRVPRHARECARAGSSPRETRRPGRLSCRRRPRSRPRPRRVSLRDAWQRSRRRCRETSIRRRRAAVLRAARDENSAAARASGARRLDEVRPLIAVQPHRMPSHVELSAEFLCLRPCATRKGCTGNTGREAEVVLDARARSRLAAGGERVNDARYRDLRTRRIRRPRGPRVRPRSRQDHAPRRRFAKR